MAHPTFKQMMNEVVAFGSCCECGTCVLVCPHNECTITVLRSKRGEELFDDMVRRGLHDVRAMDEYENSMKVMLRLTRKQRERVPVPPGRAPRYVRPEGHPRCAADPAPA